MLLEEVVARGERNDLVLRGRLAAGGGELDGAVEGVVPGEEELGREAHVLADLLAAKGHGRVHEQGRRAQCDEGVGKCGLVGAVVALGGLGGVVPALVGRAGELLGDRQRAVGVELVGATLEGQRCLARGGDGLIARGHGGQMRVAQTLAAP